MYDANYYRAEAKRITDRAEQSGESATPKSQSAE
jgi:hypothetical protein